VTGPGDRPMCDLSPDALEGSAQDCVDLSCRQFGFMPTAWCAAWSAGISWLWGRGALHGYRPGLAARLV